MKENISILVETVGQEDCLCACITVTERNSTADTHQEQGKVLPKMYLFVFLAHLIKSQMVP